MFQSFIVICATSPVEILPRVSRMEVFADVDS
jgi:hypothetical protein